MKNMLTKALSSLALIGVLAAPASALTIFNVNDYADSNPGIETVVAGNTPNVFNYKFDVGDPDKGTVDTESGDLAALLSTSITGFTATVTWAPTGSIEFDNIYLKAGNSYIKWDVTGVNWSIYDGFSITNDLLKNPSGKAFLKISHIQADGSEVPGVPDSSTTAILLGLGLVALGLFRRKL